MKDVWLLFPRELSLSSLKEGIPLKLPSENAGSFTIFQYSNSLSPQSHLLMRKELRQYEGKGCASLFPNCRADISILICSLQQVSEAIHGENTDVAICRDPFCYSSVQISGRAIFFVAAWVSRTASSSVVLASGRGPFVSKILLLSFSLLTSVYHT